MDFKAILYTTNAKKMNVIPKKLTTDDIFDSIWYDYHYPDANTNANSHGYAHWVLSQDVQDQQDLVYCLRLAEQFVECAAKSTELPFELDKTLDGAILKKVNRPGELFYDLLRQQNANVGIPGAGNPYFSSFKIQNFDRLPFGYEVSEYASTLHFVASQLNLNRAYFMGDPMSKIAEGLREGELINSLVTRLREAIKRKNFKTRMAERKKESTQNFTKSKRYLDRLYANSPYLYGVRMFLCYRGGDEGPLTLEESDKHLMKFLEPFETRPTTGSPVGWWWKREYMSEVSYRYHLIFLFDGQKKPYDPTLINLYSRHWVSVTGGEGTYVTPLVAEWGHQPSETGLSQPQYPDNWQSLLSSMQRMLMRDVYLRLKRSQKIDHFGMGKMPRLVNAMPLTDRYSVHSVHSEVI
jgi:hypothetical protein